MPSAIFPDHHPDLGLIQAKQSALAKLAMSSNKDSRAPSSSPPFHSNKSTAATNSNSNYLTEPQALPVSHPHDGLLPPPAMAHAVRSMNDLSGPIALRDRSLVANSDTPPAMRSVVSTAPNSPRIPPVRQNSGGTTPRLRPHPATLNVPGMTVSRASPDGKISDRDVAAKLVIVMVGLPARGKSYITKKVQRYLSWQQYSSTIFNVGNRRRVAAGMSSPMKPAYSPAAVRLDPPAQAASILLNGHASRGNKEPAELNLNEESDGIDQSAKFFDPTNETAAKMREQVALDTLDELLDYLLHQGGSVGILDATNSTIHRRQLLVDRIKAREPKLGILFIESICHDQNLLEANMRLKLSGPDYKDKDPHQSLADFKRRVAAYESAYVPLGEYEEAHDMQYIQMIDVGRKLVQYRLRGFLSGGISSYLTTFNLAPRQIWLTRHGQSVDNRNGKLGGDSDLTADGELYGQALHRFMTQKRKEWLIEQKDKIAQSSFPPKAGDHTPPYPELNRELDEKNFCVWTSMLKRSVQTAQQFDNDDDYDVKAWAVLNELNAGLFEGMTYEEIARRFPAEYKKRAADKLHYTYPGVGGEGYLQVIARLRDIVREIERIEDHVLIVGHRSVCRVLMAYFMDLSRDEIADLDVPLGMLYSIEPKPYGYDFHAYRYLPEKGTFIEQPNYRPQRTVNRDA
ncbi:6-phosphofructo-2-kinase [Colletotrichum scovillei]|uniref:6-phosphofructo-2-kinase n=2 Tax=Colletotrichum acutatum species complex TaxID=2707335 RepID=A0A9P7R1J5_9PEZI|nr:6-phosphofructo-2-kinase [Colletotrichum scovillei]KAF4775829.1 6-phosphofructo-2-kinase [Colletotrichum scovillei]KAG7047867.1 6-phosphofructo-2-kinase [Colletotrichum scovillei]KAG7060181.1 6-phosphofructo-2-kinase [Colletotrichum scovillei]KAG7067634.1 6-phosphofructo-2-kinase [Colletotrichum scovillei]